MSRYGRPRTTSRTSRLSVKKFDTQFTKKNFEQKAEEIFKEAAVEFVQAAARNLPSLTGQAKAAFINIAESLGVDPGVDPFDPPISEYIYQQEYLWVLGNTPDRGKTLSKSKISFDSNTAKLTIQFNIYSAHNNFGYFTWWDNTHWGSLDEATASMQAFMRAQRKELIKMRVK